MNKPLSKPFYIAGVKYSDIGKLTHISPAMPVVVSHNPMNPHDAFALEVRISGVLVGHIPRTEQAAWFYHTMDQVNVVCRVVEYDSSKPPYEQLKCVFECDEKYQTTVVKVGRPT